MVVVVRCPTTSVLQDVEFNQFNQYVFIRNARLIVVPPFRTTYPDFDIVSHGLWQLFAEPRRIIELTAGAGRWTSLSVPEGITTIISAMVKAGSRVTTVTKVIVAHPGRSGVWPVVASVSASTDIMITDST